MKYRHSEYYLEKVIKNANLTPRDVVAKYNDYYGDNLSYYKILNILSNYSIDDIRFILKIEK